MEYFIAIVIAIILGVIIGKDASSRDMSGLGWGIFTFCIALIAIPVYLIVRKPRKEA